MTSWTVARQAPLSMEFTRQNTGLGSLSLLQGIFSTQRWNPVLLHCKQILYQVSHQGSLGRALAGQKVKQPKHFLSMHVRRIFIRRRRKKKEKEGDIRIKKKKTEVANGLCKIHLMGSTSVTYRCHVASISFEIQMCLKKRQNQGRMKGSLSLTVSLKIRVLVFWVAPAPGPQCLVDQSNWMTSPSSGEKGLADIGPQTSGPLR